jgi:hypothetical protein
MQSAETLASARKSNMEIACDKSQALYRQKRLESLYVEPRMHTHTHKKDTYTNTQTHKHKHAPEERHT